MSENFPPRKRPGGPLDGFAVTPPTPILFPEPRKSRLPGGELHEKRTALDIEVENNAQMFWDERPRAANTRAAMEKLVTETKREVGFFAEATNQPDGTWKLNPDDWRKYCAYVKIAFDNGIQLSSPVYHPKAHTITVQRSRINDAFDNVW